MLPLRSKWAVIVALVATAALVGCSSKDSSSDSGGRLDGKGTAGDSATTGDTGGGNKDTGGGNKDTGGGGKDTTVSSDAPAPVGQGYAVGQISKNWTLKDHTGKNVNLYDYAGKVIFFESGSEW